jgi:hypothetical protein
VQQRGKFREWVEDTTYFLAAYEDPMRHGTFCQFSESRGRATTQVPHGWGRTPDVEGVKGTREEEENETVEYETECLTEEEEYILLWSQLDQIEKEQLMNKGRTAEEEEEEGFRGEDEFEEGAREKTVEEEGANK